MPATDDGYANMVSTMVTILLVPIRLCNGRNATAVGNACGIGTTMMVQVMTTSWCSLKKDLENTLQLHGKLILVNKAICSVRRN